MCRTFRPRLTVLLIALTGVALLTGCAVQTPATAGGATTKPSACDQIKAAYANAQTVDDRAEAAVNAISATLAAMPPNDPIRKATQADLQKAQSYAVLVREGLVLVKVALAAACPELPQTPAVATPLPPSTQPTAPPTP